MDKQMMFDIAVRGIIEQGGPALDSDGLCVYRAANGNKCAMGWLIPDEAYNPSFEGKSADTDYIMKAAGLEYHEVNINNFVAQLQGVHDSAALEETFKEGSFLGEFKDNARYLARVHNLNTEVLDA